MELMDELQKLRQSHLDVDLVMKVFEEADRVHTEAQIAMGQRLASNSSPVASTSIAYTFAPDVSGGDQSFPWK